METLFQGLESGAGLDVVLWLQAHSSPALDKLAIALSVLGGFIVYLLLFMALYWSVDKRLAKQFLLALILSGVCIAAFKLAFQRPRPFIFAPDRVYVLLAEGTYGLPSGHVGITVAVLGVLASAARWRWAWVALALYVALMGWARMVVGVHYPQDVLLGLLIGLLTLVIVRQEWNTLRRLWARVLLLVRVLLLALASALLLVFLAGDPFDVLIAGVIFGAGIGVMVEGRWVRFSTAGSRSQRILRTVVGLLVVALVLGTLVGLGRPFASVVIAQAAVSALLGFLVTAVYPWLAVRIDLAQSL